LTSSTEREYQFPFVQALMAAGHEVLYVSSHGQLERGKDVITRSPDNRYHCYQLKTGNVSLAVWQDIYGEVVELVEQPIRLPDVPLGSSFDSFLVTNGTINPVVLDRIDGMNQANRTREGVLSHLATIDVHQLVPLFSAAELAFLPFSLPDFHAYTSLLLVDGRSLLDPRPFADFVLRNLLSQNARGGTRTELRRRLHSSVVVMSNLLSRYRQERNYLALIHAHVLAAALVARFGLTYSMRASDWQPTVAMLLDEAETWAGFLLEEAEGSQHWLEGDVAGDGGEIRRARITMVLGTLAGIDLLLRARGSTPISGGRLGVLVDSHLDDLLLWGESAVPYLVNTAMWLEQDAPAHAQELIERTLREVVERNASGSRNPLPSSYYGPEEIFIREYGLSLYPFDHRDFRGQSMTLAALISLCVRRDMRALLEELWPTMVDIACSEFRPDNALDNLAVLVEDGINQSIAIPERQSWRELQELAAGASSLGNGLDVVAYLFFVLWLLLPQRFRWAILARLDVAPVVSTAPSSA
jgi:hypothetical protein